MRSLPAWILCVLGPLLAASQLSAQTGSISASPNPCQIAAGKKTCRTTLTWSATGTSGLLVRVSHNRRASTVVSSSGRRGSTSPSWIQAAPSHTYTFYLYSYAGRVQGKLLDSVTVTGKAPTKPKPAPKISRFSASPSSIDKGKSSTLRWSTSNATSVSISPGIGKVSAGGSRKVSPSKTTTYVLTATNSIKSIKVSAKVTVRPPPSTVSGTISASPNPCQIAVGKRTCTTTLTWRATGTSGLLVRVSRNGRASTVLASSGRSGRASPSWIRAAPADTYTFYLYNYAGRVQGKLLDSVKVTGKAPAKPPTISSFTATPTSIGKGERSTLRWKTSNADTLSITPGIGTLTDAQRRVYAIRPLQVSPSKTTTYTLKATNAAGSVKSSAKVTVGAPRISGIISVGTLNPCAIETGKAACTAEIQWTVKNTNSVKVYRSANGGAATLFATATGDGSRVAAGIKGSPNRYVFNLYDYSSGRRGKLLDSVTVTGRKVPTGTFTATPETIDQGGFSTLRWSTANADSVFLSPGVGKVGASGSRKVSPNSTTTYTLNVTNAARSVKLKKTVTVRKTKAPTISFFTATPGAIDKGKSATLRWSTTDAETLSISPGIGTLSDAQRRAYAIRPLRVSPLKTTTYTLKATNRVKSVTATVKVTVRKPTKAPTIGSFTASPATIDKGKSATLRWSTTNADTLSITPGIGTLTDDQRRRYARTGLKVSPSETTTYTLKATNPLKSVTATAKVTVRKPTKAPTIGSFTASPATIDKGKSATLRWSTTNADTLSITPGIGTLTDDQRRRYARTGLKVSPSETTTYTLKATNPLKSVTATAKVTVRKPSGASGTISASPNPCTINPSLGTCDSIISWTIQNTTSARIYYSLNGAREEYFTRVRGKGSRVAPWIKGPPNKHVFFLYDYSGSKRGDLLASVTVTGQAPATGSISVSPDPCTIYHGQTGCTPTVSWQSKGATEVQVWYSLNGGEEKHLASSAAGPHSRKLDVALKAGDRLVLKLYDYSSGTRQPLAKPVEKTLTVQEDIGCPPASK